jgi:hypothetical protein
MKEIESTSVKIATEASLVKEKIVIDHGLGNVINLLYMFNTCICVTYYI